MANKDSISKERTAELIAEYGKNAQDSGSAEVQVAILSDILEYRELIKKLGIRDNI